METETLRDLLVFLMSGGAGIVVYWLMENVQALTNLRPDYKRYVSWALSAIIPLAAWGVMLAMTYEPVPGTWRAGIERVFAILAVAFSLSQGLHAAKRLSPKYLTANRRLR